MEIEQKSSWPQPLTFKGLAEFAYSSWGRLWVFELVVAAAAALSVASFFEEAWAPAVDRTITALPPAGVIRDGVLVWSPPNPVRAPGTGFLWITVDPTDSLEGSEGPDLHVEFGKAELRLRSLLGSMAVPYPRGYIIELNRTELEPWWGAWHPAVTTALAAAVGVGLLILWAALGLLYAWPARLIAFYADRAVSWTGAWRLGTAALLPGGLFFTGAIVAYSLHRLNLVQFLAAAAAHVLIGWVYVLFAPFCLRRATPAPPRAQSPIRDAQPKKRANPFSGPSRADGE